jgi:hypothetical protein
MRMTVHSFDFIGVVKGFNGMPDQKLSEGTLQTPVGASLLAMKVAHSTSM